MLTQLTKEIDQLILGNIFGLRAEKAYALPDLRAAVEDGCCQWLPGILQYQGHVRTRSMELQSLLQRELTDAKHKLQSPPAILSLSTLKQFEIQQRRLVEQRQRDLNRLPQFARLLTSYLRQKLLSALAAALQHEVLEVFSRLMANRTDSTHCGHIFHPTLLLGMNQSEASRARPLGMLLVEFTIDGGQGVDVTPTFEALKATLHDLLLFPGRVMEAALDSSSAASIPQVPMECRLWVRSKLVTLLATLNQPASSPAQATLRSLAEDSLVLVQATACIDSLLVDSYSDITNRLTGLRWVEELALFVSTWSNSKLTAISHDENRVHDSLSNLQHWMKRAREVPSVMVSQNELVRLHGRHLQRDVLPRLKAIRDSIDSELVAHIQSLLEQLDSDFLAQTSLLKASANIQRPDVDDYLKVRSGHLLFPDIACDGAVLGH